MAEIVREFLLHSGVCTPRFARNNYDFQLWLMFNEGLLDDQDDDGLRGNLGRQDIFKVETKHEPHLLDYKLRNFFNKMVVTRGGGECAQLACIRTS